MRGLAGSIANKTAHSQKSEAAPAQRYPEVVPFSGLTVTTGHVTLFASQAQNTFRIL
jgi:hypothetical protein